MTDSTRTFLHKDTYVPLGVVIGCSAGLMGIILKAALAFNAMELAQHNLAEAVRANTSAVDGMDTEMSGMTERMVELEQWILRFQDLNPDMTFPRTR